MEWNNPVSISRLMQLTGRTLRMEMRNAGATNPGVTSNVVDPSVGQTKKEKVESLEKLAMIGGRRGSKLVKCWLEAVCARVEDWGSILSVRTVTKGADVGGKFFVNAAMFEAPMTILP